MCDRSVEEDRDRDQGVWTLFGSWWAGLPPPASVLLHAQDLPHRRAVDPRSPQGLGWAGRCLRWTPSAVSIRPPKVPPKG